MIYRCRVITGKGQGKTLGFPTFNLEIPANFEEKEGIYACKVFINDQAFTGALHYGPRPVYKETAPTLEVFVINYPENNKRVESLGFELVKYLRPVQDFSTPQELAAQITSDIEEVRKIKLL